MCKYKRITVYSQKQNWSDITTNDKKTGILIIQTKTKPQEAKENKTTNIRNFIFSTSSDLDEKDWMLGWFGLEVYNPFPNLLGEIYINNTLFDDVEENDDWIDAVPF